MTMAVVSARLLCCGMLWLVVHQLVGLRRAMCTMTRPTWRGWYVWPGLDNQLQGHSGLAIGELQTVVQMQGNWYQ